MAFFTPKKNDFWQKKRFLVKILVDSEDWEKTQSSFFVFFSYLGGIGGIELLNRRPPMKFQKLF